MQRFWMQFITCTKTVSIEAVCVSPKDYENREQFINAMHNSGQQDPIATIIGLIEEAATK